MTRDINASSPVRLFQKILKHLKITNQCVFNFHRFSKLSKRW